MSLNQSQIAHCDHETFFLTRDKNLAAASSNSQRRFYHSSDFDSKTVAFSKESVP